MATRPFSYDPRRAFWQRFIDECSFDSPSQPAPRHGGPNWVKIEMPPPARWITGYGFVEGGDRVGLYLSLDWKREQSLIKDLFRDQQEIRDTSGVKELNFNREKEFIGIRRLRADLGDETAQIEWLCTTANGLVNAFRPYLLRTTRRQG